MIGILFVCLGNICRSPSAEGVMQKIVENEGLEGEIFVDSAGTIAVHAGENADSRMKYHASRRSYELTSISRQFNVNTDFDKFTYIIAMDDNNYRDLMKLTRNESDKKKVIRMTSFCTECDVTEVPDPYYGGSDGFELVLDILEDACRGLLSSIRNNHSI